MQAGTLEVDFKEGNIINLDNIAPISDIKGQKTTPYTFSVENTGTIKAYYKVSFEEDSNNTLDTQFVKYRLTNDKGFDSGVVTVKDKGNGTFVIKKEEDIAVLEKVNYTLHIWLSDTADNSVQGKIYKNKIVVNSVGNKSEAEASEPVLATNMIPVKYDGTNWVKADTSDTWYDYDNQEWANAVTVSEASRSNYLSADANTPISMDDINTMWVWIPRYSYTIGSEDGTNYYGKQGEYLDTAPTKTLPGEIDVKFISISTKDTGSAQYKVSEGVSGWRTPDGFTFGDKELSGIWVAKFETSNQEGTYESDDSNLTPIVKPKVTSWRDARVSTMETAAMNMTKENNIYGLSNSEVDSHMMKNSEWALVAYLSQSKYGKLGNKGYTGANKEIYMNNYTGYKTGCSAGMPSAEGSNTCAFEYDNLTDRGSGTGSAGGGASTTGNIYGIYDMSGGSYEYVMGNYNNYSGYNTSTNSGYNGPTGSDNGLFEGLPFPDSKYYDLYTTNDVNTACNGKACTSQALSEVEFWYGDNGSMIYNMEPWMLRGSFWDAGGTFDKFRVGAGVFCFTSLRGGNDTFVSFRLVLTP